MPAPSSAWYGPTGEAGFELLALLLPPCHRCGSFKELLIWEGSSKGVVSELVEPVTWEWGGRIDLSSTLFLLVRARLYPPSVSAYWLLWDIH